MEEKGDFWSTYGWHPLSLCAASATLDVLEERGEELFANAMTLGAHARERAADSGTQSSSPSRLIVAGRPLGREMTC